MANADSRISIPAREGAALRERVERSVARIGEKVGTVDPGTIAEWLATDVHAWAKTVPETSATLGALERDVIRDTIRRRMRATATAIDDVDALFRLVCGALEITIETT